MEKEEKIVASFIIEVVGKPPEHLNKVLEGIIEKINEEKGVKVLNSKIHDSKPLKEAKEFFINFAEIEIQVSEILTLMKIMFMYMPAHIEILEPASINLTNNEWTDILTTLTLRLHKYDETARILQSQKIQLEKKLKELIPKEESKKEPAEKKED